MLILLLSKQQVSDRVLTRLIILLFSYSPANSVAAQLYQENRREYEKRVAAIVEQSWLNFPDDSGDEEGGKKNESSEEGAIINLTEKKIRKCFF